MLASDSEFLRWMATSLLARELTFAETSVPLASYGVRFYVLALKDRVVSKLICPLGLMTVALGIHESHSRTAGVNR